MAELDVVPFDAAIPGQSLTAELGSRPWQQPAQYTTVEEALDYYIPRLESEEVSAQLLDVLEMGIPVTTVANTLQLGSVMEGKHSVDVGMLILPVLVELIMLDLAVSRFKDKKDIPEEKTDDKEPVEIADEKISGLMSRRVT